MNRTEVFSEIQLKLELELREIESSLNALVDDLANETKSSAGDKYETAREMIQQEREQLENARQSKRHQLLQINRLSELNGSKISEAGSIIETDLGIFLLGVSVGKIELTNKSSLFVLGLQSPLSQALLGKTIGDTVSVNQRNYNVKAIY